MKSWPHNRAIGRNVTGFSDWLHQHARCLTFRACPDWKQLMILCYKTNGTLARLQKKSLAVTYRWSLRIHRMDFHSSTAGFIGETGLLRPWLYSRLQSPLPLKEFDSLERGLHSFSLTDRLLENVFALKCGPEFCDYSSPVLILLQVWLALCGNTFELCLFWIKGHYTGWMEPFARVDIELWLFNEM